MNDGLIVSFSEEGTAAAALRHQVPFIKCRLWIHCMCRAYIHQE